MKFSKLFSLSFLALAASAASAATQPINAVTDSYVTFDTAALASNNFSAAALGGSTYSNGKLTDAVSSVSTSANPGAALVQYDAASGIALSTSIAFVGTVKVNMTNFSYNFGDNTLYGDLLVSALGSSKTYSKQAILVAGKEVGTLGTNDLNSVSTSLTARDLNYTLTNFSLASDLQTQLGSAVSFVSWLPAAVQNITVYTKPTAAVPEASTYAMMGLGLVGIAAIRRRKQD